MIPFQRLSTRSLAVWSKILVLIWVWMCGGIAHRLVADDWTSLRGPRSNGISKETDWSSQWPNSGPVIAWRSQVGIGFSSVVVSRGKLYTLGNTDNRESIFCIDARTGVLIWKHEYDCSLDDRFFEGGPTATPTVDGDRLYSISRQGDLFCLEADSGRVLWEKNVAKETGCRIPGWGFSGSPVIHENRLLLNVGEAGLAIDKLNGELLWKSGKGEAGYMTPLPWKIEERWYALIASGKFYQSVDIETGAIAWRHRWLTTYGCNASSPILSEGRAFISSGYGRGSAVLELGKESYKVLWSNQELRNQLNSSLLVDGHLYGFDGDEQGGQEGGEESEESENEIGAEKKKGPNANGVALKCVDFSTGVSQWSFPGLGAGSLMAAGNRLIVLSQSGELLVAPATPTGFQPTCRAKILNGKCWTVPVLSNGYIYCRNATGEIACVDVHSPTKE